MGRNIQGSILIGGDMEARTIYINFEKEKRSRKLKKLYQEAKDLAPTVLCITALSAYIATLIYFSFQKEGE